MTAVAFDLKSDLAFAALALSVAALAAAVFATRKMPGIMWGPAKATDELGARLATLQKGVKNLQSAVDLALIRVAALESPGKPARPRRAKGKAAAAKARCEEFLQRLEEWVRWSSLRIQGAAAESRDEIAGLASSSSRAAAGSEERLLACANNLVEFLVEATDAKFKQRAPEQVNAALEAMVKFAGRELIAPQKGAPWSPAEHEVVGKLPRGPNRAGTVAVVSSRGLRGGPRRAVKARVFLYDD